jgi:endogenous inhibitor of DNA gyrase (YacG/DUF329 family)
MKSCPSGGTPTARHGNIQRPFCSLHRRLIDLGVCLDERYRIPAESVASECSGMAVEDDVS